MVELKLAKVSFI